MSILEWGWNARLEQAFEAHRGAGMQPARVVRVDREHYRITCGAELLSAVVSGRFRHQARIPSEYPAVGDWVVAAVAGSLHAVIHAVLPRASCFSRKVAGRVTEEQVVAANVDFAFLVSGLDADFQPRRIERYVTTVWESGASPVIVLNKADLCADADARLELVSALAAGVPAHAVSAQSGAGVEQLACYLEPGRTVALLGSSGVGKSTLVNALAGRSLQATAPVRESDQRGQHTTTFRELVPLPGGALLVDTPGMRELQLWSDDEASLDRSFADLEQLAGGCRFRDCGHDSEPGCAVRAALASGDLDAGRFASWQKLERELRAFAVRHDQRLQQEQKRRLRSIMKAARKKPDKRD